jgi:hypothetical protein
MKSIKKIKRQEKKIRKLQMAINEMTLEIQKAKLDYMAAHDQLIRLRSYIADKESEKD